MSSSTTTADGKKKKEGKVATCRYCDMTFRKLEHAQRHERTHTLDRPYSCDTCGKTFARQDTLHRHSRLHNREDEDGPAGKAPRKRRVSNASATKPAVVKPEGENESSPDAVGSSGSSSSPSQPSIAVDLMVPQASTSASTAALFPGMGLSMSLPVAPPSFPAYSQPEHADHHHAFPSIDPSFIPLSRRFSDAGYPTTLAAASLGTSAPATSSSPFAGAAAHGLAVRPDRPALRPRAMTLAGLPESLGCFSLINSPASSHASLGDGDDDDDSSMSSGDDDDDDLAGDSDIKVKSSSPSSDGESGAPGGTGADGCSPTWATSFPAPESHYPSPAFSAYSPTQLHRDPLEDLQSILENDPVGPSSRFHAPSSPPPTAEPEFDYASFAASIEGPAKPAKRAPAVPVTLDELLGTSTVAAADKVSVAHGDVHRYPTPPSGSLSGDASLPVSSAAAPSEPAPALSAAEASASFNLAAHLNHIMTAESEQLARADRAATLAMFANGFGVTSSGAGSQAGPARFSPAGGAASSLSALGLAFGPPPAQIQAHARGQRGDTTSASPPLPSPSSTFSSSAYALSATFATTYPSLSLPVAGFDRLTSSALKYDTPPMPELVLALPPPSSSSPSAAVDGTPAPAKSAGSAPLAPSPESCIDLLARAWEKRSHRQPALGFGMPCAPAPSAAWQAQTPFAHPAKSVPAFYIPTSPPSPGAQHGARGAW
ncbi:hypothetical protein JCM3775_004290 [Rhodotorula graminis]